MTKEKTNIKLTIMTIVLSAFAGSFFTSVFDKSFDFVLDDSQKKESASTTQKVKPKILFTWEYSGYYKKSKFMFIPVGQTGWAYNLKVANFTGVDLSNFQIEVKYKKKTDYIFAKSFNTYIFENPETKAQVNQKLVASNPKEGLNFIYPKIPNNTYHLIEFAIGSNTTPKLEDIEVNIVTKQGKAYYMSPVDFSQLGWQKTNN